MKKQEAFVHVSDGSILKTRRTFAGFQEELGEVFIRIRRGCLVSAMAIHSVNELVNLSNGDSLEYSAQHRKEIIEKFRQKQRNIIVGLADNDNPEDNNDYHEYYRFLSLDALKAKRDRLLSEKTAKNMEYTAEKKKFDQMEKCRAQIENYQSRRHVAEMSIGRKKGELE